MGYSIKLSKESKKLFKKFVKIYAIIVVFFAIIYTLISNNFYYATSKHEIYLKNDTDQIKANIEYHLVDNFIEHHKIEEIYIDKGKKYVFNINNLKVNDIIISEDNFTIKVLIKINDINNENIQHIFDIGILLTDNMIQHDKYIYRNCEIKYNQDLLSMYNISEYSITNIFKVQHKNINFSGIIIPKHINNQIEYFMKMSDGMPSEIEGNVILNFKWNFPRMLYLSMVTITTLGYGDIVPLTNIARILIGLESTLGIILLGWFVNKIMYEKNN